MTKVQTRAVKKRFWSKDDTELTVMALPSFIWYVLFCFIPMFGVILAFKDYRISGNFFKSMWDSAWVGINNFKFIFASPDIWMIIRNTLGYNAVFIVLNIVVPVILAIIISQLRSKRMGKIYQTAMFLPYFLSWVVISSLVWAFLSYERGLFNRMITDVGGEAVQWYMKKEFWPGFLVFMNLWKSLGYSMVIYLAAITGLDVSYYEAAVIDGASRLQQARFITVPLLKTVIILMFILAVGRIFYADFGLFYQVPRDSNTLYNQVYVIDVYVYKMLLNSTTGMASAAAALQAVVGCVTILTANWIVRKVDPESAMM
ncbi:MAG: ABC transporter permease subunit [Clostridiales bacterium]|jgi:putative aldouronate transport system permease protein|nr:ABC transporter permease subunit [Clostridiales bacterium]